MWLFRMDKSTRPQSHFAVLCASNKSSLWLACLGAQLSILQDPGLCASQNPSPQKKHHRRAPNIGPIHDVFVDTDPFDPCDHPPPNKHKQFASLRSRAYRRAAALRTALLAEFAHRCTPVTTCIPLPHSGLHTRPLLTTTPGAWGREQRWLQAALEILRWWCGCGLSIVEVSWIC
jgi:hypothetical protein